MPEPAAPSRTDLAGAFLARAGWADAERRFLAGDASDRSYARLIRGLETAVLMDAPPGKGDDPAAFLAIARHLRHLGLSAPRILAEDLRHGFLLLEDLGDALFARLIPADPAAETPLYAAATDVLLHLQARPAAPGLPDLTAQDWAQAAAFALDWYRFAVTGEQVDTAGFLARLTDLLRTHADGPRVMILRDYHAENLLWLPQRAGLRRVGLLDFQLAQMGQPGYDLVSLLQDARRDVPEAVEAAMIRHFLAATGAAETGFAPAYAVLGAQRTLRILGIFARLCLQGGKPQYVALIPRVWAQLQRNLAHPALAPLAAICQNLLPEPTPDRLERIRAQCGKHPTP
ncbi:MAG TPA: phosphotransferase [Paracoccaceae bacterium]